MRTESRSLLEHLRFIIMFKKRKRNITTTEVSNEVFWMSSEIYFT